MRSLGVAVGVCLAWIGCSSQTDPTKLPELADCLDVNRCGPGIAVPASTGRNLPPVQADAGVDVVVPDVGIPPETIPEAGPGPGISGITGAGLPPGSAGELGPVCPALAPTNGAPCDPIANSLPCSYARLTCSCVGSWICF
jgi:hypothetical protein